MAAAGGSWKGGKFTAKSAGPRANVTYEYFDRQYRLFSDGERSQWGHRTKTRSGRLMAWHRVENPDVLKALDAGLIPGFPGGNARLRVAPGE